MSGRRRQRRRDIEERKRSAEAIQRENILLSDYLDYVNFKLNRPENILRVEPFWPKNRPLARGNHKISSVDADSSLSVEIWSFDSVPFSEDFFFLVITGQIRVRSTRSERTWNARQSSFREVCDERGRMEDEIKEWAEQGWESMGKESRREEAWEWKVVLGKCADASRNAAGLLIRLRCQSAYRGKSKGL